MSLWNKRMKKQLYIHCMHVNAKAHLHVKVSSRHASHWKRKVIRWVQDIEVNGKAQLWIKNGEFNTTQIHTASHRLFCWYLNATKRVILRRPMIKINQMLYIHTNIAIQYATKKVFLPTVRILWKSLWCVWKWISLYTETKSSVHVSMKEKKVADLAHWRKFTSSSALKATVCSNCTQRWPWQCHWACVYAC